MSALFTVFDVLLMPTVPGPAAPADRFERAGALPTVLGSTEQVGYTTPWNVVGFPAISVPAGRTGDGLPLAVQLVGPPGSEGRLLALAAQLEQEQDWTASWPPIAGYAPRTR
jgi:amidase